MAGALDVKALVTGGYLDVSGEGVLWCVDFQTEKAEILLRWSPPPHLRIPGKGFAGGCLDGRGRLYVAAHAAVVRIDLATAQVSGVLHQPCMNDLHHVALDRDRLLVVNTGLCSLDVFSLEGGFLGSHGLVPTWANARRIAGGDPERWEEVMAPGWGGRHPGPWGAPQAGDGYHSVDRSAEPFHRQKVPDHLHPNHVCLIKGRPLLTCLYDGSLRDPWSLDVRFQRPGLFPHDGILSDGGLWLTGIDGTILCLDAQTLHPRWEGNAFETGHWGWCRGLAVLPEMLLVGLTEVRAGHLPPHRWSERSPEGSETSILALERETGRLLARVDLTDKRRHSKLYSILPLPIAR